MALKRRSRGWKSTGGSGFAAPPAADAVTGGTPYEPVRSSWGPGPTPAPAPAAAPAPTVSAAPDVNFKDSQWQRETGDLVYGAGRGMTEFGATAANGGAPVTFDEKGNPVVQNMSINWDPDAARKLNPFSKAALLIKSYQQGVSGTSNSYAARGQHNSGAYQRAQNSNQTGFEQGRTGLNNALMDWVQGLKSQGGAVTEGAILRESQKPQAVLPLSNVGATGTWTYGNTGTPGNPSANQMFSDYSQREVKPTGNIATPINGTVKLASGWTLKYVNGKPQFIPPGGK